MREKTTAGISGVYFGYMKACTQLEYLSDFKATMAHISFATGYTPQDQKIAVNTMIAKKGKSNLVKDLRTINLMEANFNFNNKVVARLIMNCAEENKLLPDK